MVAKLLVSRPSSDLFLSSAGIGLSFALLYVALCGGLFDLPGGERLPVSSTIVFLAVVAALYALAVRFSDVAARWSPRVLLLVGSLLMVVASLCPMLLSGLDVDPRLSYVFAAAYAVGFVSFKFAGAYDVLFVTSGTAVFASVMCMALTAVALFAGGGLFNDMSSFVIVVVVIAIDILFFFFSGDAVAQTDEAAARTSRKDLGLSLATAVSYGVVGAAIGFYILTGVARFGSALTMLVLGIAIAIAVVLAAACAVAGKSSLLMISPAFRVTLVPLVAFVLVLPIVTNGIADVVCWGLLLVTLFLREISRLINRLVISSESDVHFMHFYAWTSFPTAVGMLAGAVFFFIVSQTGIVVQASIALALVVCLASVIAPYGVDQQSMPDEPAPIGDMEENRVNCWKVACSEVSSDAGLTPRECDVALLLSRGRSADVIARNLGISIYTVKTHVSNIYHKSGVESHQDFIDLVEERFAAIKQSALEPKERL